MCGLFTSHNKRRIDTEVFMKKFFPLALIFFLSSSAMAGTHSKRGPSSTASEEKVTFSLSGKQADRINDVIDGDCATGKCVYEGKAQFKDTMLAARNAELFIFYERF